jgi:hypothetical protein
LNENRNEWISGNGAAARGSNSRLADTRTPARATGWIPGRLALLLAGLGLYGLTAHATSRRRTEIVIRDALGGNDSTTVDSLTGVASLSTLNVNGFDGNDTAIMVPTSTGTIAVNVHGGNGTDTLTGPDGAATWNITDPNLGNITGVVNAFRYVEVLNGGSANDTFNLRAFATGTATVVAGAGGTDTLNYNAESRAVSGDITPPDGVIDSPGVQSVTFSTVEAVNILNSTPVPTTVNDSYSTSVNTGLTVTAPGVLSNDNSNGGGAMTAGLVSTVSNGTLTLNANGSFIYTPNASFVGTDSFTYRASNAAGAGNVATVSIVVGASLPVTVADVYSTNRDAPLTIAAPGVLSNDSSNGGGALTAVLVSNVSYGTLALNANGGFSYTPTSAFTGTDAFTYRAESAVGPGNTATVTINVVDPTMPQPPTGLVASSIVGNLVTFRWIEPTAGPDPTDFVIEGGILPGQSLASLATGSTAPIFTVTVPDGSFYVRARTVVGTELSAPSNEIRIFVNMAVPPSPPANLLANVNGSSIDLAWINTFAGGSPDSLILDVVGAVSGSLPVGRTDHVSFNGVPAGTYNVSVRAANASGASASSNDVTITIPGVCLDAPLPPENFLAYRIGSTVHAIWEPGSSGSAPTSFLLHVTGSATVDVPISTRSVSGVVGPGVYNLSLQAINSCGASASTPVQTVVVP